MFANDVLELQPSCRDKYLESRQPGFVNPDVDSSKVNECVSPNSWRRCVSTPLNRNSRSGKSKVKSHQLTHLTQIKSRLPQSYISEVGSS